MTLIGGTVYSYLYGPPIARTYNVKAWCLDGNGNTVNSSSIPFTASTPATPAGGGGGGTVIIEGAGACEFNLVKPTNLFVNAHCPAGEQSENFSITLYNPQPTTQNYELSLDNVNCQFDETTFSMAGKAQHTFTVSKCACPTNETIQGNIIITNGACNIEVPIQLYTNIFGRFFSNQEFLWRGLLAVFIVSSVALALVWSVTNL